MRADIHDGPEQKLQSEAGYIDARPLNTRSTKASCNARPDHTCGSKCEILTAGRCFPLCSQQRTLFGSVVHGRLRLPHGQSVTPLREKRCDRSIRLRVVFFELARSRAVGQKASLATPQAGARPITRPRGFRAAHAPLRRTLPHHPTAQVEITSLRAAPGRPKDRCSRKPLADSLHPQIFRRFLAAVQPD
jgi:hypothetical protein